MAATVLFRRLGDVSDIALSIEALEASAQLQGLSSLQRMMTVVNLGATYGTRYEAFGDREDLDNSIKHYRDVLAFPGTFSEMMAVTSGNLSLSLICRFDVAGDVGDLEEALTLAEKAMDLLPLTGVYRPNALSYVADALLRRYRLTHERSDIDKAINALEECIAITNAGQAFRSDRLLSLSRILLLRWKDVGKEEGDVDRAIQLAIEALSLRQSGHPRRHEALNALSSALSVRFNRLRLHSDYFAAVQHQKEAIDISPPGSAFRPQALFGLARLYLIPDAPNHDPLAAMSLCKEALEDDSSTAYLCLQDAIDIQPALESAARHPSFSPDSRGQLLSIYQTMLNLLPRVAYFGLDASARLRVLKSADHFATTAAAHAILLDRPETAVEILEQGRGVFWSQGLKLRSQFDQLPADLRDKISVTAYQLERAMCQMPQDDTSQAKVEVEEADRKIRRLSDEFQELVEQIRSLPGHERFLLPLNFAALSVAAERGPVVVFLTSETVNCAIIIQNGGFVEVVKLAAISSRLYEAVGAALRGSSTRVPQDDEGLVDDLNSEDRSTDDGVGRLILGKPRRSNNSVEPLLAKIWTSVMEPVTKALNLQVLHAVSHLYEC